MAKIYDKIIKSNVYPNTDSLWLHNGNLKYFNDAVGKWEIVVRTLAQVDLAISNTLERVSLVEDIANTTNNNLRVYIAQNNDTIDRVAARVTDLEDQADGITDFAELKSSVRNLANDSSRHTNQIALMGAVVTRLDSEVTNLYAAYNSLPMDKLSAVESLATAVETLQTELSNLTNSVNLNYLDIQTILAHLNLT